MVDITKQRNDLTTNEEDFQWVMEDYFGVTSNELEAFPLEKTINWEYNDIDNSVLFYFEEEWTLNEFKESLMDSPLTNGIFHFEEWSHIDLENLTIRVDGKMGGLI